MIRLANINDCSRLAEIHVFTWRHAYRDFISKEYLINGITVKGREEKWQGYLSDTNSEDKTYVFEEDLIVKGFMTIGDCRDEDKDSNTFELHGIYVDPLFQRQKIGTKFANKCIEEAKSLERKEITLWVFEKNKSSISFYENIGFKPDGKIIVKERFNENAVRMKMEL